MLKRSSPTDGVQELYYFLEKDVRLNISYIGKMTSILNEDKVYPAFEACAPFHIILLTENQELFKNQVFIQNLFTVVKSYAKTICPSVSHIIFDLVVLVSDPFCARTSIVLYSWLQNRS